MKETDNATNAAMEAIDNLDKEIGKNYIKRKKEIDFVRRDTSLIPLDTSSIKEAKQTFISPAEAENEIRIDMAEMENAIKSEDVGDSPSGEAMSTNKNATDAAENSLRTAEQEAGIPT